MTFMGVNCRVYVSTHSVGARSARSDLSLPSDFNINNNNKANPYGSPLFLIPAFMVMQFLRFR